MLKSEALNGVTVYEFDEKNKLNAVISEDVKEEVGRHFEKPGTKLILDLNNIAFVDSSGFGALLSIMKKAKSNSGTFRICNIANDVMSLFKLLQLHNVFEIYESKEECLKSFS